MDKEPRKYKCSFCKAENALNKVVVNFIIPGGGGEVQWRLCSECYPEARRDILLLTYGKS